MLHDLIAFAYTRSSRCQSQDIKVSAHHSFLCSHLALSRARNRDNRGSGLKRFDSFELSCAKLTTQKSLKFRGSPCARQAILSNQVARNLLQQWLRLSLSVCPANLSDLHRLRVTF